MPWCWVVLDDPVDLAQGKVAELLLQGYSFWIRLF